MDANEGYPPGRYRFVALLHGNDAEGYGVSFPDFPGCVSTGRKRAETLRHGHEALMFHLRGMAEDGIALPLPRTRKEIESDADLRDWVEGALFSFVEIEPSRREPQRISIRLDEELVERVDQLARQRGTSRSAVIKEALRAHSDLPARDRKHG